MSTLPFGLPACGLPAADRIEVYSGHVESLDASIYACPQHSVDIALSVMTAGLAPRLVRMAPDITRACGSVYVYPTGSFGSFGGAR